jgi:hypothetical protein
VKEPELSVEQKAQLFDWLMSKAIGRSLHMDGTAEWHFPSSITWYFRTRTPHEAVAAAHAQSLSRAALDAQSPHKAT